MKEVCSSRSLRLAKVERELVKRGTVASRP
jgi:hypothetical protein